MIMRNTHYDQSPIPNPQSPITNPQSPKFKYLNLKILKIIIFHILNKKELIIIFLFIKIIYF